jgi:putative ABC transport system permease protein
VRTGDDVRVTTTVQSVRDAYVLTVTPLGADLHRQLKGSFARMGVAAGLSGVALLLAALGIFGVFSCLVEERRREIGIRRALGASSRHVRLSLASVARWPLAAGLTAGVALALIGSQILRANLYGVSVLDPLSYLAVAVILACAAGVATWLPLRRALRLDPTVTLEQE